MSVARVVEISSTSEKSFEDAINQGVARATATLRGVTGAWIKEQQVSIEGDRITSYKVMNPMNKFEGLSLLTNHLGSFLKATVLRRRARDSCHASRVISAKHRRQILPHDARWSGVSSISRRLSGTRIATCLRPPLRQGLIAQLRQYARNVCLNYTTRRAELPIDKSRGIRPY